ncbi:hypothetical protein GOBAR_DD33870 [Gossypium barbadense]|nr:hypothetical protein GOBAR_DD33870 [Gossypium barbadense]
MVKMNNSVFLVYILFYGEIVEDVEEGSNNDEDSDHDIEDFSDPDLDKIQGSSCCDLAFRGSVVVCLLHSPHLCQLPQGVQEQRLTQTNHEHGIRAGTTPIQAGNLDTEIGVETSKTVGGRTRVHQRFQEYHGRQHSEGEVDEYVARQLTAQETQRLTGNDKDSWSGIIIRGVAIYGPPLAAWLLGCIEHIKKIKRRIECGRRRGGLHSIIDKTPPQKRQPIDPIKCVGSEVGPSDRASLQVDSLICTRDLVLPSIPPPYKKGLPLAMYQRMYSSERLKPNIQKCI